MGFLKRLFGGKDNEPRVKYMEVPVSDGPSLSSDDECPCDPIGVPVRKGERAPVALRWTVKFMKYSVAHLLLVMALVAMGVAWWVDHARLSRANEKLNTEAAELFQKWTISHHSNGFSALEFRSGELPSARVYDFSKPEDRAAYTETYGHIGSISGF